VLANAAQAAAADAASTDAAPGKTPDTTRPTVTIKSPAYGTLFNRNPVAISGTVDDGTAAVTVNGVHATIRGGTFTTNVVLAEQGSNPLVATAVDRAGNQSKDSIMVTLDSIAPDISISRPPDGWVTNAAVVTVEGQVSDARDLADVTLNDAPLALERGAFSVGVPLVEGENRIVVSASDAAGNSRSASRTVVLKTPAPAPVVVLQTERVVSSEQYAEAPVGEGGTLTGRVTFKGTPPAPKTFAFAKFPNTEFCGKTDSDDHGNRVVREVNVGEDNALRDVVVYFEKVETGKPFKFDGTDVKAEGCKFLVQGGPSTLTGVVMKKKEIRVLNMDADPTDPKAATGVLHNPHSYEVSGASRATIFNLPLAEKGQMVKKPVILRKKDSTFFVECDQHNYMQVHFQPIENPYYAIVGEDGTYSIGDIPPGTYEVYAWHPTLGKQETNVTIQAKSHTKANFSFAAK